MKKLFLLFCFIGSIAITYAQNINWVGGVSTKYFDSTNWNPVTNTATLNLTKTLMIGTGTNNCIHTGGNTGNPYRPAILNTLSTSNFICNGILYFNGNDSLNGTVNINAPADMNCRNILNIARNGNAVVSINSGTLTSKNGTVIASGVAGSTATVNISGTLNVGGGGSAMNLSLANGAGLTAYLNLNNGTVNVAGNLLIGTDGHIFISGIGLLKITGDKQAQLNGLITDGRLTCTLGKTLTIAYDGVSTTVKITVIPGSMITEYTDTVVLNTTNLVCVVEKNTGRVRSYRYKGVETVGGKFMYHDFNTSKGYESVWGCSFSIVEDNANIAHIVLKRIFTPSLGQVTPCDIEIHYILNKDDKGVYVYSKLEHKPNYPKFDLGEYRHVWWMATKTAATNLCERIYTDSLRSWQMPAPADSFTVTGIKEIIKIETGVRAGMYDCKYQFTLRPWLYPQWGHASNVNNIGCWMVSASCEYYNEGPMYHDLNSAAGIIHNYLNGSHYGSGGMAADTLTSWTKVYGPYLMLITDKNTGDANWEEAKQRQMLEKTKWPYTWVKDTLNYPPASLRGTVSGKFVIADPLKPDFTGANAWVGVTDLSDGASNFQFECKNYQYWVKSDANGNFSIPNVRPGTYTLNAFVDGAVGEYKLDNVSVIATNNTNVGTLTRNIDRAYGHFIWEIGKADRTAAEFKMGDFDYCLGYVQEKFRDTFPEIIEYNTTDSNWATKIPYVHTKYPDVAANPGGAWKWRINFTLPPGTPTTGNARLTFAYASNDHAQQWIYVNNEASTFTTYYPANGDGNAFLRQSNYAKYSTREVLIPMSRFVAGNNTISLAMPSNSAFLSHIMYDYISLEAAPAVALPIKLTTFEAVQHRKQVQLNWVTSEEINYDFFILEKSINGISFNSFSTIKATNTAVGGSYAVMDETPSNGFNYYRLKIVATDGSYAYSRIKKIKFQITNTTVEIYPNPATTNTILITAPSLIKQLKVCDANGKIIMINNPTNTVEKQVIINGWAKGIYYITITTADEKTVKKFIKH